LRAEVQTLTSILLYQVVFSGKTEELWDREMLGITIYDWKTICSREIS